MRNPFVDQYGLNGFGVFAIILLFLAVLIGGGGYALNAATSATCRQEGKTMHVPIKYHAMSGCYLQIKGQWVPDSTYVNNQGN